MVTGPTGPAGASSSREVASDWVAPYSYMGVAASGSNDSDVAWRVTRIEVVGATAVSTVASPIRWSDRLTAIYT
jgi:hypothetical protein